MLTLLLQRQFIPYTVRSYIPQGQDQFTATLCSNGYRVGKVTVTKDPEIHVAAADDVTMLLEFTEDQWQMDFDQAVKKLMLAKRIPSEQMHHFVVDMILDMVEAHREDKKIHDLVRRGHVVYRLKSDVDNDYHVLEEVFTPELAAQLRKTVGELSWIANEEIQSKRTGSLPTIH